MRGLDAGGRILEDDAARRLDADARGGDEEDVGRGLAMREVVAGDDGVEESGNAEALKDGIGVLARAADGAGDAERLQRRDECVGAGQGVGRGYPLDQLLVHAVLALGEGGLLPVRELAGVFAEDDGEARHAVNPARRLRLRLGEGDSQFVREAAPGLAVVLVRAHDYAVEVKDRAKIQFSFHAEYDTRFHHGPQSCRAVAPWPSRFNRMKRRMAFGMSATVQENG